MVPDERDRKYDQAWQELFDNEGFDTLYGPTTCEVRSRWYDGNQTSQCCWWYVLLSEIFTSPKRMNVCVLTGTEIRGLIRPVIH